MSKNRRMEIYSLLAHHIRILKARRRYCNLFTSIFIGNSDELNRAFTKLLTKWIELEEFAI